MARAKTGQFLNVDFDPNLSVVMQDMARIEHGFEDKKELFGLITAEAKHDVESMFDDEKDAFGIKWPYWKRTPKGRSYAERAEKLPNIGILNRYGREDGLRSKATAWEAFVVTGSTITYGTGLPEWASVHLHGGHVIETKDEGMYEIPRRSFYPFTLAGSKKVGALFYAWGAGNIAVIPRMSTKGRQWTQVQKRVSKGRWGSSPL